MNCRMKSGAMATPSEFQRLSSNASTVISACFKMDCKVFGLISRCIGTQGCSESLT